MAVGHRPPHQRADIAGQSENDGVGAVDSGTNGAPYRKPIAHQLEGTDVVGNSRVRYSFPVGSNPPSGRRRHAADTRQQRHAVERSEVPRPESVAIGILASPDPAVRSHLKSYGCGYKEFHSSVCELASPTRIKKERLIAPPIGAIIPSPQVIVQKQTITRAGVRACSSLP